MRRLPSAFLSLFLALAPASALAQGKIVVFAAASLKTALDGAAADYRSHGGGEVAISYGGSLSLARQIAAGAPADVFASADERSMDEAAKAGAIRADSRVDLLGNRLVVVAPKAAPSTPSRSTPKRSNRPSDRENSRPAKSPPFPSANTPRRR